MLETYGIITRIKLFIDIFKVETMFYSIVSQPFIKQASWLIESRFSLRSLLWGWTMPTVRVTMLISMETKWTCMLFRHIWLRQKHNFALVINFMRILPMVSHLDKLCRMLRLQVYTYQWEIHSLKSQIIVNCFIKQLFLSLLISLKIIKSFY